VCVVCVPFLRGAGIEIISLSLTRSSVGENVDQSVAAFLNVPYIHTRRAQIKPIKPLSVPPISHWTFRSTFDAIAHLLN
jgi:hypothetical protein